MNGRKTENGFTLIEMAMVIIIIGLMTVAFSQIYTLRQKHVRAENTSVGVSAIVNSIASFRGINGRYPCPAPMGIDMSDPAYGRETDCENESIEVGSCVGGICVQQSVRDITYDVGGVSITGRVRVRVGEVPFRQLNLREDQIVDGYGNRLRYVVTERLAVEETFAGEAGGISILDSNDNSVILPESSAHFVLISLGENGAGAYTRDGGYRECLPDRVETDNCALSCTVDEDGAMSCGIQENAMYRSATFSTADNDNYFDDIINYFIQDDLPLWQTSNVNSLHIHQKGGGNVGVRMTPSENVDMAAIVNGAVLIRDDADTDGGGEASIEGKALVEEICNYNGTLCFPVNLIAGDIASGSIHCENPNEVIMSIANGQAQCGVPEIRCNGNGMFIRGIDSDGNLICADGEGVPPPEGCAPMAVVVCGATTILPQGREWERADAYGGQDGWGRGEAYYCRNGSWRYDHYWGGCECEEGMISEWWDSCGDGFTGHVRGQGIRTCTPYRNDQWTTDRSQCVCVGREPEVRPVACPAGTRPVNGGMREMREFICHPTDPTRNLWGDWSLPGPAENCVCDGGVEERTLQCPEGQTGDGIRQSRTRICPSGEVGPWTTVPGGNMCNCTETTREENRECPAGDVGQIVVRSRMQCPSGTWTPWETYTNTCAPPPVRHCKWTPSGSASGPPSAYGIGSRVGDPCDCGVLGACYDRLAQGSNQNYSSCRCD